jgi:hypothetical protein
MAQRFLHRLQLRYLFLRRALASPEVAPIACLEKFKWPKKHMKKCSPSLSIKGMQIKTTLRFHLTPVRIAIIKNTTNNICW